MMFFRTVATITFILVLPGTCFSLELNNALDEASSSLSSLSSSLSSTLTSLVSRVLRHDRPDDFEDNILYCENFKRQNDDTVECDRDTYRWDVNALDPDNMPERCEDLMDWYDESLEVAENTDDYVEPCLIWHRLYGELKPSAAPSAEPTKQISLTPSESPTTAKPSFRPSAVSSQSPSMAQSATPSLTQSSTPSVRPSTRPSVKPSVATSQPSTTPPTQSPTSTPTKAPISMEPTIATDAPVSTLAPITLGPAPGTAAPVTTEPTTAPVTAEPITMTAAPITPAPIVITGAPITSAPTVATAAPITSAPTVATAAPITPEPTPAPVTPEPTPAPVTPEPTSTDTGAPVTPEPTPTNTGAPVTPPPSFEPSASPITPQPITVPSAPPTENLASLPSVPMSGFSITLMVPKTEGLPPTRRLLTSTRQSLLDALQLHLLEYLRDAFQISVVTIRLGSTALSTEETDMATTLMTQVAGSIVFPEGTAVPTSETIDFLVQNALTGDVSDLIDILHLSLDPTLARVEDVSVDFLTEPNSNVQPETDEGANRPLTNWFIVIIIGAAVLSIAVAILVYLMLRKQSAASGSSKRKREDTPRTTSPSGSASGMFFASDPESPPGDERSEVTSAYSYKPDDTSVSIAPSFMYSVTERGTMEELVGADDDSVRASSILWGGSDDYNPLTDSPRNGVIITTSKEGSPTKKFSLLSDDEDSLMKGVRLANMEDSSSLLGDAESLTRRNSNCLYLSGDEDSLVGATGFRSVLQLDDDTASPKKTSFKALWNAYDNATPRSGIKKERSRTAPLRNSGLPE